MRDRTVFVADCRNSPACRQAGVPAEGSQMRRPLFIACLCLVIALAIGNRLTGAETGDNGGLPPDGSPVRITGRIDTRTSETILLEVISIIQNDQQYSYSGKLQCELTNAEKTAAEDNGLKIGQKVILEGTFAYFSTASNPGEFDVQAYYAGKGIGGSVRKAQILETGEDYHFLREKLYGFRLELHDRLAKVFPDKEASIMQTLLLGEKEALDADVKALYQKNGIAHILSISGLHITLLGMGVYRLLKRLGGSVKMAAVGGAAVLVMYGMMVGMSVSASRAIGMYVLRMLGVFVGRTYDMLTGVGLLALLLVLQEPERLGDVSFFMSFGAVLGICILTPVLAGNGWESDAGAETVSGSVPVWLRTVAGILGDSAYERNKYREGWRKGLHEGICHVVSAVQSGFAASAGVILFTLPIQLWFFYEIPVYSVLLNLLVLPLMSVVMAGGILSLIPGLGIVGTVDCLILWWYEWICGRFGGLPGAIWCVGRPAVWQIVIYYIGIFLLIFGRNYAGEWKRRGDHEAGTDHGTGQPPERDQRCRKMCGVFPHRIVTVVIPVLLVVLLTGKFDSGSYVTFLDVGQGDGIVVETAQGAYLFDCGSTSRKKIGEYVLKPYLRSRGIRSLRGVFVSHPDEDHMNGVLELLENGGEWGITVEQLFLPAIQEAGREEAFADLLAAAETAGVPVCYIKRGDEIKDRGLRLLCLHPEENTTISDANAYSECFYVEVFASGAAGKVSLLLTGDVEGEGERQLIQELQKLCGAQELCEADKLRESSEVCEVQELQGQESFNVDILKVAHHGSGYSTSSDFLSATRPTAAIISCGRNNSYGHPHAETLQRLEDARVPWYCTTDYGALTVTVDGHGNRLRGYLRGR